MKALDDLEMDDLWERVRTRTPRPEEPEPGHKWRARSLTYALSAVVLALIVVVMVTLLPLGEGHKSPTDNSPQPSHSATPAQSALGSSGLAGWDFRVTYQNDTLGPVLQATNYGLPDPQKDFYGAVSSGEPRDGIAIQVQEFVGVCGCTGFSEAETIRLSSGDLEPWDDGKNVVFGKTLLLDGQYLSIFVHFGSSADASAMASVNEALATVSVDHAFALDPTGSPDRIPPLFAPAAGWQTAAVGSNSDNLPIAWASTVSFSAEDLREGAVSGTLVGHPPETLKSLGPGDVFLLADWWQPTTADVTHASPSLTEPLQLAGAQIQNQWEGQVADNVPEYYLFGNLDGRWVEVRAFFGTQDPDQSTLDRAQAELDRLTFPSASP